MFGKLDIIHSNFYTNLVEFLYPVDFNRNLSEEQDELRQVEP